MTRAGLPAWADYGLLPLLNLLAALVVSGLVILAIGAAMTRARVRVP